MSIMELPDVISSISIVAHQGGWDEMLMVAAPLLLIGGVLRVANKRVKGRLEDDDQYGQSMGPGQKPMPQYNPQQPMPGHGPGPGHQPPWPGQQDQYNPGPHDGNQRRI